MKYVVKNKYGIRLKAERKTGPFAYVPRVSGLASYEACNAWIRRYDTAETCVIVDVDDPPQREE